MNEDVWFGYLRYVQTPDFKEYQTACQTAEQLDLDFFMVSDHFNAWGPSKGQDNYPLECWSVLSALATLTTKIRLGPLVSCVYYRAPTLTAKIATTVDIISGGRLVLGLGAGNRESEFRSFYGHWPSVPERLKGFKEALDIISSMMKNDSTTYKGSIFSAENAVNRPRPVQDHVPLLAGVFGKTSIKIATKHADIIHCLNDSNPDNIRKQKRRIREGCKKTGRNPDDIRIAGNYPLWLNPTPQEIENQVFWMVEYNLGASGMNRQQATEYVKQAPSTIDAHIEAIQDMINNDVKVLMFTGPPERLQIFGESVFPKLK
jgi:alkanesulfonate monooxygenase SsuD/methylene tetrahydromethanopterin reductase-like flavin-dependent oxidoreductase (luciferase family)